jgi:tetratricopeptide (TPR) repeat protein
MIVLLFSVSAAADDYFTQITAASNGRLTRFDHSLITLYVDSIPASEELKTECQNALLESLSLWEEVSGGKVKFKQVNSPNDTDIKFTWTYKLMHSNRSRRIGEANLVRMEAGKFHSEALKVLDVALAYSPFSYILHYDRAIALSGAKQYEKSIAQYKLVLYLEPNFSPAKIGLTSALNNLGIQKVQANAFNEAIKLYSEALEWDSECREARQNLESIYLRLGWEKSDTGKFSEAMAEYQRALTLNPKSAEAYNYIGSLFYKQRRYDDAIEAFKTALRLKPQFSDAALNLKYTRRSKMVAKFRPVLSIFGISLVSFGMIIFSVRWVKKCSTNTRRRNPILHKDKT